ncbi:alpha/beta hydrolase [Ramlibacter montanisoli]|uniref:Alpha/beta hydrolase n=1 Tax=Ramlibacter montanisoli TaxID=2732512 RepID=A0A849K1W4_9BURK|nr:alpha/beta hydrolase [Ramlibacter montanisoli]NNU42488.1 alpha/beta hydrolase [Ramlibacter montanisoli]
MRFSRWSPLLLAAGLLAGCFPRSDPSQAVPTAFVAAPQAATRMVVVLPGRADDIQGLRESGIVQAVQSAWPDADVVLTGLALPYYLEGVAEQRLHREVIAPARRRGYAQIWLVGASLGGMGSIMYQRAYPGEVTGMVLLAPYLGDEPMLARIRAAGGIASWEPPSKPAAVKRSNFQEELWRHVQSWSRRPEAASNVWLAYGRRDQFRNAMPLLAAVLPPDQVLVRGGGHDWGVWSPVTREVLSQIDRQQRASAD